MHHPPEIKRQHHDKEFESTTDAFLAALARRSDSADPRIDGVEALRRSASRLQLDHALPVPETVAVENLVLKGRHGDIPIRLYRKRDDTGQKPLLIYFHGGAWVIGGLNEYDGVCATFANAGNVNVMSVGYRLAPEHRFPAAVDDCFDAVVWATENQSALDVKSGLIGVAGDSAGGNLAAVICQLARRLPNVSLSRQILIYPCLAAADHGKYPSLLEHGTDNDFLNERDFQYLLSLYRRNEADEKDPRLWPVLENDLSELPDAFVVTAEFDMLRDEASAYCEALRRAGNKVFEKEYKGTIHGFIGFAGTIKPGAEALGDLCAYLRNW